MSAIDGEREARARPTLTWVDRFVDGALYAGERRLRFEVLRRPLGMVLGSEENAREAECRHLVAWVDREVHDGLGRVGVGEPAVVGCTLWLGDADGRGGKLLQMAVDSRWQGTGLGARLVRELERKVFIDGFREVRLHARETAIGFYRKLGYEVEGETFFEVGLPHKLMRRTLA